MINKSLIVKSMIYRISAFIFIVIVSFILTGKYEISLLIGIIEFAGKLILYYLYEIIWIKIKKMIRGL